MTNAQTRQIVLTRAQQKVLSDIKLFQDKTGHTQLSVRQLVSLTGIPRSTVSRTIWRLNDFRLIFTYRGNSGKPTVHRVLSRGAQRPEPVPRRPVVVAGVAAAAAAAAGARS